MKKYIKPKEASEFLGVSVKTIKKVLYIQGFLLQIKNIFYLIIVLGKGLLLMRSYKIEIKPTKEQILKIENTSNVCRFIYNEMIATNELLYEMSRLIGSEKQFMGANDFSKYINNKLSKISTMTWIKTANSKAIKQAMVNC
ncbi:MAG: helix-turn-helix domain-containing protein, partial [Cetobacterium sp.]